MWTQIIKFLIEVQRSSAILHIPINGMISMKQITVNFQYQDSQSKSGLKDLIKINQKLVSYSRDIKY